MLEESPILLVAVAFLCWMISIPARVIAVVVVCSALLFHITHCDDFFEKCTVQFQTSETWTQAMELIGLRERVYGPAPRPTTTPAPVVQEGSHESPREDTAAAQHRPQPAPGTAQPTGYVRSSESQARLRRAMADDLNEHTASTTTNVASDPN